MSDLIGTWHSHYEYGQGPNDELQVSEHDISFKQIADGRWVGKSLPTESGSEVLLTLNQEGDQFTGEWCERTSPTGHYQGHEFKGSILLLLSEDKAELRGMWLGTSSDKTRVKAGRWVLRRDATKKA